MALFAMGAPADNVNRLRRRARVGQGFLHHHRDRASTTAVRQTPPRAYADRLGVPPGSPHLPRARRFPIPAEPVDRCRLNLYICCQSDISGVLQGRAG